MYCSTYFGFCEVGELHEKLLKQEQENGHAKQIMSLKHRCPELEMSMISGMFHYQKLRSNCNRYELGSHHVWKRHWRMPVRCPSVPYLVP